MFFSIMAAARDTCQPLLLNGKGRGNSKRVVVITGCSEGSFGYELAKQFYAQNCCVYATARRLEAMRGLPELGIHILELDVTSRPTIQKAIFKVISNEGRIDVLVNSAGLSTSGPVAESPIEKVRQIFDANFFGTIEVIREVFPFMAARKYGRIVNIGSVASSAHRPWKYVYCASKAAIRVTSDAMRVEMRPLGIKVLLLEPGYFGTNMVASTEANTVILPEDSVYKPFEQKKLSILYCKRKPMPVPLFASKVAKTALSKSPPWRLVFGEQAHIALLFSSLPQRLIDWVYGRMFGLSEK